MRIGNVDVNFIVRSPAFSELEYDITKIDEILDSPYFYKALENASPTLWKQIYQKRKNGISLTEEELYSLKKYINRIHFRATPFGLFASVGISSWAQGTSNPHEDIKRELVLYSQDSENGIGQEEKIYFTTNPSVHKVGRKIKYIRHVTIEERLVWSTFMTDYTPHISLVIAYCRNSRSMDECINLIKRKFHVEVDEINAFLNELLKNQILLSNQTRSSLFNIRPRHEKRLSVVEKGDIRTIDCKQLINYKVNTSINLYDISPIPLHYNIAERIHKAVNYLEKLSIADENGMLKHFTTQFAATYDQRSVCVLECLDPEIGLKYGSSSASHKENKIFQNIFFGGVEDNTKKTEFEWTDIHILFLNKLKNRSRAIQLHEKDIESLPRLSNKHPSSISVIFRITTDGSLVLEEVGGISGTTLLGRFTEFPNINEQAKKIADFEIQKNPGVIFAEVNCYFNGKDSFLNKRAIIYPYQINIGLPCTEPHHIPLWDLFLFIQNGQLILYSKRLNSRIIPRMSSAYNYRTSNLPLLEFLCDLQYQNITSNLTLNLPNILPGLSFYPRVVFDKTIIRLATWFLKKTDYEKLKKHPDSNQWLNEFIAMHKFPQSIRVFDFDRYLVFNLCNRGERDFFIEYLRKSKGDIKIEEYPFQRQEKYNRYANKQFVVTYYNESQIYTPIKQTPVQFGTREPSVSSAKWLYFKLYCHANNSFEILLSDIMLQLRKLKKDGVIDKWFYINYKDPEQHIRLRLHMPNFPLDKESQNVIHKIFTLRHSHLVKNVLLQPYRPEIERYGKRQMPALSRGGVSHG